MRRCPRGAWPSTWAPAAIRHPHQSPGTEAESGAHEWRRAPVCQVGGYRLGVHSYIQQARSWHTPPQNRQYPGNFATARVRILRASSRCGVAGLCALIPRPHGPGGGRSLAPATHLPLQHPTHVRRAPPERRALVSLRRLEQVVDGNWWRGLRAGAADAAGAASSLSQSTKPSKVSGTSHTTTTCVCSSNCTEIECLSVACRSVHPLNVSPAQ